jgi:hypothetical protein
VLSTIDIDLPRPRWSNDEAVKASPQFIQYRKEIWHTLKDQIRLAEEALA